ESYRHTVALCDRCKSRIEPRISLQWWCAMDELKQPALEALRSGRVRFHPESQHRFAIASLGDAPDWNISRQIWWGHQLPLWECPDGHVIVQERTGGRMSKSLGTGMNPIAQIEAHGADATRYGLMKMASSQDVAFSEVAIEEGRKLANKLWNASRLLILAGVTEVAERPASLEERWILARISQAQRAYERYLGEFDF